MKHLHKIKGKLFEACLLFVNNRLKTITQVMESNQNALLSETKSSASDKHETGRAMLQLEMEKAGQQLDAVNLMKQVLTKITLDKFSTIVCLGSLVCTSKANYYLSISAGKIMVENVEYFAVSTNSPIGQQLLGKKVGETIAFNNAEVLEIA